MYTVLFCQQQLLHSSWEGVIKFALWPGWSNHRGLTNHQYTNFPQSKPLPRQHIKIFGSILVSRQQVGLVTKRAVLQNTQGRDTTCKGGARPCIQVTPGELATPEEVGNNFVCTWLCIVPHRMYSTCTSTPFSWAKESLKAEVPSGWVELPFRVLVTASLASPSKLKHPWSLTDPGVEWRWGILESTSVLHYTLQMMPLLQVNQTFFSAHNALNEFPCERQNQWYTCRKETTSMSHGRVQPLLVSHCYCSHSSMLLPTVWGGI